MRNFEQENETKSINELIYGTQLSLISKKGKIKKLSCFYLLEDDPTFLQRLSKKKKFYKTRIDLLSITNISDKIEIRIKKSKLNEDNFLNITYKTLEKENNLLILYFENKTKKNTFWQGLQYFLVECYKNMEVG